MARTAVGNAPSNRLSSRVSPSMRVKATQLDGNAAGQAIPFHVKKTQLFQRRKFGWQRPRQLVLSKTQRLKSHQIAELGRDWSDKLIAAQK